MESKEENPKSEKTSYKTFLDKTIDFIFSNDERKWLILIFIFGMILRFFVAKNVSLLGDEGVHGPHTMGYLKSGLISSFAHSPLWFSLTDLGFRFMEVTIFSLRFLSFFYGSLTILLVFLLAKKVFHSKRIALLSSFLLAISYFTIRFTLMEMDLAALFFLVLAVYAFILSLEKNKFPWLAAISIGLAALIKTLSLYFLPAFLLAYFILSKKPEDQTKKEHLKKVISRIILFGIIIVLVFSPILAHNYFLCKDKNLVDVYFGKYFRDVKTLTGFPSCLDLDKAQAAYGMQSGYETTFEHARFFEGLVVMSKTVFKQDPLIVLFGALGIILMFLLKEKRRYWGFLFGFNFFGFLLLVLSNWLTTHFVTLMPMACIFAAFFLNWSSEKLSSIFKTSSKNILMLLCGIILLVQLILLLPHLTSASGMSNMRNYAIDNMDKNSIVIADSRIYRGRIAILFHDFHYIESSLFSDLMQINQQSPNPKTSIKVYFVECVPDDCGWGTIKDQPEFNQSVEAFVASFQQVPVIKTLPGGGGYEDITGEPYFRVYAAAVEIDPQLLTYIDNTHDWWYYPHNYEPKERIFDNYEVSPGLDSLFYMLMKMIHWLSIFTAIILSFWPFYYLVKNKA